MDISFFKPYMTGQILMGPNTVRILESLWKKHPLQMEESDIVLDLGCGKGLSSFVVAKETTAKIYACDLWTSAADNEARFAQWGIQDRVISFQEDANNLQFGKEQFQGLVSIDAYHYFGTKPGFFEEKILPLLKNGAQILIGIPGIKEEYTGRSEEMLSPWLGEEAYMFKSASQWREIIGDHHRIKHLETWELDCFEDAWQEWLATENEYAAGDRVFFETRIKPYTCLVGIYIELK